MPDPEVVDGQNPEQGAKKGSNMTLILIIVAVVALLLSVGGAFFMISMLSKQGANTEETQGQNKSKSDSKEQADAKKPLGELFSFERAVIVNLAETNAERYLKVDVVLELDSAKLVKEVESRLPQIQDLLISITSTKTLEDVSTTSGRNMLRQEIVDKINSLLATGQVTNVYFTEFVVQ